MSDASGGLVSKKSQGSTGTTPHGSEVYELLEVQPSAISSNRVSANIRVKLS